MTTIKISELHPAGYDLLADSETYMNQLDNNELDSVRGGEQPFNDRGDYLGYAAYTGAAALSAGGAAAAVVASPASTPACTAAAYAAGAGVLLSFAGGFKEAYD